MCVPLGFRVDVGGVLLHRGIREVLVVFTTNVA
jgi:hypothetical protein